MAACADLSEAQSLINELQENVTEVRSEWETIKQEYQDTNQQMLSDQTAVKKTVLKDLQNEIQILKRNLGHAFTADLIQTFAKEQELQHELECSYSQVEDAKKSSDHWKARHDSARALYEQERKEKFCLKNELSETNHRVSMQSDYCAGMGAICCTLLWRASQHQQTIPTLLVGVTLPKLNLIFSTLAKFDLEESQMENFMSVVCHTLDSFMATYQAEDMPSEQSEELQFVMALCGTITNIAASSEGRDYLANNPNCNQLIHTFIALLATPASKNLNKLKNLLLMALYNLSINQKGLQTLTHTKNIVSLLVSILQGEKHSELRLHTLLLMQSLIMENTEKSLLRDVKRLLSMDLLKQLSHDTSHEVTEVTGEIIQIINSLDRHEP